MFKYKNSLKRKRRERRRRDLSQGELARKASISTNFLGHIERGTKRAMLHTLERIAGALKVSLPTLFISEYETTPENLLAKHLVNLIGESTPEEKNFLLKVTKTILKSSKDCPIRVELSKNSSN